MVGKTTGPVVGFAGMTHLGIVSAIATAARGFRVIGHDAEASLVGRLDRQYFPILKPDLDRLLAAKRDRISFTATASDLSDCDIVYIAADVPTDDEGASDLAAISARLNRPDLTSSRDHAVLVVLCQVPPGTREDQHQFVSRCFDCCRQCSRRAVRSIDADWAEIVPALRLDRRIEAHAYLDPGVGIAGGNSSAISGPCSSDQRTVLDLAKGRHRRRRSACLDWDSRHEHNRCWRVLEGEYSEPRRCRGLDYRGSPTGRTPSQRRTRLPLSFARDRGASTLGFTIQLFLPPSYLTPWVFRSAILRQKARTRWSSRRHGRNIGVADFRSHATYGGAGV
jgi:hypothetical protein